MCDLKQTISIIYRVSSDAYIIIDPGSTKNAVHIVANKSGMAILANAVLSVLLSRDGSPEYVQCNVRNIATDFDLVRFELDGVCSESVDDV